VTDTMVSLDEVALQDAANELASRDTRLARIIDMYGPPPLWAREPGFSTLLHIILEQQVSLASAKAAYDKVLLLASPLTPERFLTLNDAALKGAGFSRQKARYGRELAEAVASGRLDLDHLQALADDAVCGELMAVKGIGRWTADIYLLMALRRPDVWPRGDLALATAARRALSLPAVPGYGELEELADAWRPWRAVAARLLWHSYLSEKAPK